MSYSGSIDIRRGSTILPKLGTPYFILTNYVREPSVYCCEIFVLIPRNPEKILRHRITTTPQDLPDTEPSDIPNVLKDEVMSWGQFQIEEQIDDTLPQELKGHYFNLTFSQSVGRPVLYRLLSNGGLSLAGCDILEKSECKELQGFAKLLKHLSSNPLKWEEF